MDEILRIAICEDTPAEEEHLLELLNASETPNQYEVFHSAEDLLAGYKPHRYDLLLMDIYMGGMTGVDAVTKIREVDREVSVAFVPTSKDFALESYRLSALKYIEKPYRREEVEETLQLALMKKINAPALHIFRNGKEERLSFDEVVFLEAQIRQLSIYLVGGEVLQVYEKLSHLTPQLERHHFFSPHSSFCVNLAHVRYIDSELRCFLMDNGKNVPIRRESMGRAKRALEAFLFQETRGMDA